jgi:post-segregation antitoxin (ccd killing protein)
MNMAQRITITLPDNLHERLQTFKEKLNVSGICQEAIDSAIQIEEIKVKTDIPAIEKAIARLRKEKQETCEKWKQIGFKDGVTDAVEELDYQTIKYIGEGGDINKSVPGIKYEPTLMMEFTYYRLEKYHEEENDFDSEIYTQGWIEGVIHVWNDIKDKL